MTAPVRVLYSDLDGTLLGRRGSLFHDGDGKPAPAAAEALVRAAAEGLEIVPLTGRSHPPMFEVGRILGLSSWICEFGAVRVYERGAEVVRDPGEGPVGNLREALDAALAVLLRRWPGRIEEHSPWNAARESSLVLRGLVPIAEAESALAGAGFAWARLSDNGVIPRAYDGLPGLALVRAYHLVPAGVSKVNAVRADRARRGLTRAECAVVGDSGSDVACGAEVGRCFLVRNGFDADPDLAFAAGAGSGVEVTAGGWGAGFAEAVQRLLDGSATETP